MLCSLFWQVDFHDDWRNDHSSRIFHFPWTLDLDIFQSKEKSENKIELPKRTLWWHRSERRLSIESKKQKFKSDVLYLILPWELIINGNHLYFESFLLHRNKVKIHTSSSYEKKPCYFREKNVFTESQPNWKYLKSIY